MLKYYFKQSHGERKEGGEKMEDQRVFARIEAKFPLRFLDPNSGKEGTAETVDVSANGVGLVAAENLAVRTPLEMWLQIPDQHDPFYTRGEVVWTDKQRVGVRLERAELMGLARVLWFKRREKS